MRIFLVIVLSLSFSGVIAQTNVLGNEYENDTTPKPSLMLLPCPEKNYFSDSDFEIIKNTDLKGKDMISYIMDELYFNVHAQLLGDYEVYNIKDDSIQDHQIDLRAIQGGLSYKYDTPTPELKERDKNAVRRFKWRLENKLAEKDNATTVTDGELTTEFVNRKKNGEFYNAKPYKKEMLAYYHEKYQADLFIFLNQIEIKKMYGSQADRWAERYYREIWVHFSIYDKSSNLYFGDVVKIKFNSKASNLQTIIRNTFPKIGEYIEMTLP